MFVRNGKQAIWPFVVIAFIVLLFLPWCIDFAGFEIELGLSKEVNEYLLLTWMPTAANVLIVALLLGWFGAPMISEMLADRKQNIERSIDEAARVKAEADLQYNDAETKLEKLDEEVANLRESYENAVKDEQIRILEETQKQSERIEKDANVVFELQSSVAAHALEREVLTSALDKARVEISSKLAEDASLRDKLIDQGIASLNLSV